MPESNILLALTAWKQVLGPDAVVDSLQGLEAYTKTVCASKRAVTAVLKPVSLEQVQQIVSIANQYKTPLYPISCGKQWGMGSKLPVKDGAAIVDLSGMNRIHEVSEQFHYAVVEPGVTQKQIIDYIEAHKLPLMLNVTGSTSDSSLIGNALDRGVGYFDSRAHGISNMKVVLGNGETIQTGFGHYPNAHTQNLYHYGVGPSLDGLFPQGNFGIVTSACIDLIPMPQFRMTTAITIDSEDKLPSLIEALVRLRKNGYINTITHIGNRERSHISFAPHIYEQLIREGNTAGPELRKRVEEILEGSEFGPWTAGIGILGTNAQIKLAKKEIRRSVSNFAKVTFVDEAFIRLSRLVIKAFSFLPYFRDKKLLLNSILPVCGYTQGKTTDASLKTLYWPAEDYEHLNTLDPDQSNSGTIFCLPIVPADGSHLLKIIHEIRDTFTEFGFTAAMTFNLLDSKALEGVISLAFSRLDEEQIAKAHACIQALEKKLMILGYPPYRVGINSMHHVVQDDIYWNTINKLKKALDPNSIIAPGRYNLS